MEATGRLVVGARRRERKTFTHVECDSDDVQAHGGVGDAAEGRRLKRQEDHRRRTCQALASSLSGGRGEAEAREAAHPVDFGQFVSPPAPLVPTHQLRRGALFSRAAEPGETNIRAVKINPSHKMVSRDGNERGRHGDGIIRKPNLM